MKKLTILSLLLALTVGFAGCSEPAEVNMEEALQNKNKVLGEGHGTKYSPHEGGLQFE